MQLGQVLAIPILKHVEKDHTNGRKFDAYQRHINER